MKCTHCGLKNEPGNRFCMRCGAPIEYTPGKTAKNAEPPEREAGAPQRAYERKLNVPALLMGALSVLLAAVIALMATGITDAVFAPKQRSFTDPDDAISYFIGRVKAGDYDCALSACAIKKAAANFDYQAMADKQQGISPYSQLLPPEYGMYEYGNEISMKNNIMRQLSSMAMTVTLPGEYADFLKGRSMSDDEIDLSRVVEDMDPAEFFDIEVVQTGEPEENSGKAVREYLKYLAKAYGADEAAARMVLYKANGDYYAGGLTLLRYGDGWMIFSLANTAGLRFAGGELIPLGSKSDFRDLLGGDYPPRETPAPAVTPAPAPSETPEVIASVGVINIYSFTTEISEIAQMYKEQHPEFPYDINTTIIATTDGLYEPALDAALISGDSVDIYCAESAFVTKYTQGDMSGFAIPYEDLGIDVAAKTAAAQTARYVIDVGTRPSDGKVVGLGYQSTAGVFAYRRSIAMDVWGTDDPDIIKTKIGPGWDKFFDAAKKLKAKGFAVVSGDGDIWHAVANSADKGWIVDGKLYIDPKREAFLDYSKELKDKGYTNQTYDWTEAWYADMADNGAMPVFGFFVPTWMINYVMPGSSGGSAPGEGTYGDWAVCEPTVGFFWGGTWLLANKELDSDPEKKAAVAELIDWITLQCGEDSLQYAWANGNLSSFGWMKDSVTSGTVMAMSNGENPFLGGQNMYDAFRTANDMASGKNITVYDSLIESIWRDQVRQYTAGNKTRKQALADFKQAVKDQLGIDS